MKLDDLFIVVLGWMVNEVVGEMVIFVKIEITSSIWREEIQNNRNRLLDLAGRNSK